MPHKIIFSLLVAALITVSQTAYAFGPLNFGFSKALEYQIMDKCVGVRGRSSKRHVRICACALEKTQEDGFWPDYDNDDDYWEDEDEFMKAFWKNVKSCVSG